MTTPAKIEPWIELAVWEIDSRCLETGAFFNRAQAAAIIAAHAPKQEWEAKEKALLELVKALLQKYWRSHPQPRAGEAAMILSGVTWSCPHCQWTNGGFREICRNCGYDSNAGEFPYYNPLPPYEGSEAARKEWEAKEKALREALITCVQELHNPQGYEHRRAVIDNAEAILNREQEKP